MLDEFIKFVQQLFPSIDPYISDQLEIALDQFKREGKKLNLFQHVPFDYLSQGDILNGIPFIRVNTTGDIESKTSRGMIISNTCSCDHDEDIIIAPIFDGKELDVDLSMLKCNKYYRLMYLPDYNVDDYAVDFSLMNTFSTKTLNRLIELGKVKREKSLNQFGFYLLITKLTVCFLRPEDLEVQENRRNDYLGQYI